MRDGVETLWKVFLRLSERSCKKDGAVVGVWAIDSSDKYELDTLQVWADIAGGRDNRSVLRQIRRLKTSCHGVRGGR